MLARGIPIERRDEVWNELRKLVYAYLLAQDELPRTLAMGATACVRVYSPDPPAGYDGDPDEWADSTSADILWTRNYGPTALPLFAGLFPGLANEVRNRSDVVGKAIQLAYLVIGMLSDPRVQVEVTIDELLPVLDGRGYAPYPRYHHWQLVDCYAVDGVILVDRLASGDPSLWMHVAAEGVRSACHFFFPPGPDRDWVWEKKLGPIPDSAEIRQQIADMLVVHMVTVEEYDDKANWLRLRGREIIQSRPDLLVPSGSIALQEARAAALALIDFLYGGQKRHVETVRSLYTTLQQAVSQLL